MKQHAVDLAFRMFVDEQLLREATVEWGMVLYERAGVLAPGRIVASDEGSRVQVYTQADLLRVAGQDPTFDGLYLGDHHSHPYGMLWTSQLPSPDDLRDVSVLYDLWPVDGQQPLQVAPRLQLVQSMFCGDVFAMEPVHGRPVFPNVDIQKEEVEAIVATYRVAFLRAEIEYGAIDLNATPADLDALVGAVLPNLNAALGGRAVITFHPNLAERQLREAELAEDAENEAGDDALG